MFGSASNTMKRSQVSFGLNIPPPHPHLVLVLLREKIQTGLDNRE